MAVTYIIAEAGTGHFAKVLNARYVRAEQFIDKAAECGADAVKFQLFIPGQPLFCPVEGDDLRWQRWEKTFLHFEDWRDLKGYATRAGVDLMWSVFQEAAVEWLIDLAPKYIKVASRANRKFPFEKIGDRPLIVSDTKPQFGRTTLKCVAEYPAPLEMCGYEHGFAGVSDHSGTIWPALDAIAHGARFVEVHFKFDGADMGNDAPVCLDPTQLSMLCEARDAFARMHEC